MLNYLFLAIVLRFSIGQTILYIIQQQKKQGIK